MGVLSIDQVRVFLSVVDQGSFSAAARALHRHQSAISYAMLNLETQLGVELFDRSGKMPRLTPAGAALVPDARKAAYSLDTLRDRARGFARGIEAEVSIAVDAFCPLDPLTRVLGEFGREFPMVRPVLQVQLVGTALELMLSGRCAIGILSHPISTHESLVQQPIAASMDLAPYVAAGHPLIERGSRVGSEELAHHTQLVHAEISGLSLGQEFGVLSSRTWQSNSLGMHHALLRAGVGWGFVPRHLVRDDQAAGRLVRLELTSWPNGGHAEVPMMAVRHVDAALGPAATWLMARLSMTGSS